MPARPLVPGVVKSVVNWDVFGAAAANVLHWAFTGTWSPALLDDFATAVGNAFVLNLLPDISPDVAIGEVVTTDLSNASNPNGISAIDMPGTASGAPGPASACVLISETIDRRYRGGHPRVYIPGVPDSARSTTDSKSWNPAAVAAIVTSWDALVAEVKGFSVGGVSIVNPVSVSYFLDNALRVTPVVDTIVAFEGKDRICSQRRRLGKAGG